MSSHFTKTGPVNLVENASIIASSEACKGSNTLLELTPLKDKYKGLDWDCVERY